jgi:hypothetical protein
MIEYLTFGRWDDEDRIKVSAALGLTKENLRKTYERAQKRDTATMKHRAADNERYFREAGKAFVSELTDTVVGKPVRAGARLVGGVVGVALQKGSQKELTTVSEGLTAAARQ